MDFPGCGSSYCTFAGLVLVDIALRFKQSARYVKTAEVYHRPPSKTYNVQIKDLPAKPVPYQKYYGSYPSYKCTLTTDVQGFRNLGELKKKYDIVTIGDSFTEGSDSIYHRGVLF